jgi:hypothetical protein
LKDWSVEEIADLLESGKRGLDSVEGSIAAVVLNTKQIAAGRPPCNGGIPEISAAD